MSDSYKIYASEEYVNDQVASTYSVQPVNRFNLVNTDSMVFEMSGNNQASWITMWSGSYLQQFFGDNSTYFQIARIPYAPGSFVRIPLNFVSMNINANGKKHLKFLVYNYPTPFKNKMTATIEMANSDDPTVFTEIATYYISTGWNNIILPQILDDVSQPNLRLLIGFADTLTEIPYIGIGSFGLYSEGYTGGSPLIRTGHLYSYDADQNATFPAAVSATSLRLTDSVTGTQYTLTIQNGELVISP